MPRFANGAALIDPIIAAQRQLAGVAKAEMDRIDGSHTVPIARP